MALEVARAEGIDFAEAWGLAVQGQICDSYRSARGSANRALGEPHDAPPNLRTSAGQKRCAGCRFITGLTRTEPGDGDDAGGRARCMLYGADVFPGVLWPHRTDDRRQWQAAISTAIDEWERSYNGEPSRVGAILDAIRLRGAELALARAAEPPRTGHIAA